MLILSVITVRQMSSASPTQWLGYTWLNVPGKLYFDNKQNIQDIFVRHGSRGGNVKKLATFFSRCPRNIATFTAAVTNI